MSCRPQRQKAS